MSRTSVAVTNIICCYTAVIAKTTKSRVLPTSKLYEGLLRRSAYRLAMTGQPQSGQVAVIEAAEGSPASRVFSRGIIAACSDEPSQRLA